MTDESTFAVPEETPPTPPKRRTGLYTFVGAALVALVVIGAVGVFALVRSNGFGDRMASAEAMPADMQIYIDIDFGSMNRLDQLLGAFDAAFADAGLEADLDTLIDELDTELRSQLGVGVDDVTPWVGRDLGIGIGGLDQLAALAGASDLADVPVPDILMAVSVRDGAGADAFMDDMVGILETRDMMTFSEDTYQGVRLLSSEADLEGAQLVAGRSGDLLLMGSSQAVVRRAIDAQSGPSLADDTTMKETLDLLPGDRAATVYISGDLFDDLLDSLGPELLQLGDVPEIPENTVRSMAMSLALTDDGVQFDFVGLSGEEAASLLGSADELGDSKLPEQLPEETFLFFGVDATEPVGEALDIDEVLAELGLGPAERAEVDAALEQIEAELGLSIQTDIIDLIRGDFALGVFDATIPLFGTSDLPEIGFSGLLGTTDAAAMKNTLDKIADFARRQGIPVEPRNFEGGSGYAFSEGGPDLVVLGVAGDYVVAASQVGALNVAGGGGPSLADDAFFQQADRALGSAEPVFFVDLQQALRAFDAPPDVLRYLEPVQGMVAGGESVANGFRFTLLTLIDY